MNQIRTRVMVALASSAVLASGLSMAVVAFTPSSSAAAVSVADGSSSGTGNSSNVIIVDP
jgi:hypothetical protein